MNKLLLKKSNLSFSALIEKLFMQINLLLFTNFYLEKLKELNKKS